MLFEDAFVTTDREALAELFEEEAVLGASRGEARGGEQISRLAAAMWARDYSYVADPLRIVQARDTALVVEEHRPVPLWQHMMVGSRLVDLFAGESADGELQVDPDLVRHIRNLDRRESTGAWTDGAR